MTSTAVAVWNKRSQNAATIAPGALSRPSMKAQGTFGHTPISPATTPIRRLKASAPMTASRARLIQSSGNPAAVPAAGSCVSYQSLEGIFLILDMIAKIHYISG